MGSLLSTSQPHSDPKSEAQFAMESSCFCVVCGSPFDLAGEVYNLETDASRYKWLRNHRLIASKRDVHLHNLAGLSEEDFHSACYNTSDSSDVFLSARATWEAGNDQIFQIDGLYPDTNIPYPIKFNAMQQIEGHDTVFPVHEYCLYVGRRAVESLLPGNTSGQQASSLSILNKMLQSRYRDNTKSVKNKTLVARNDLFDLCTATEKNGPRSVVGLSLLQWWAGDFEKFYTDPIDVPGTTVWVLNLLKDTTAPEPCQPNYPQATEGLSIFEQLPAEIFDHISTYLSAYATLALYQVSRTLAMKAPLDNSFWRQSITSGNALPYLWDLEMHKLTKQRGEYLDSASSTDNTWNWKAIGQLLARRHFPLNTSDPLIADLPNGLWNRRRIWSIIEEACRRDYLESATKDHDNSLYEERKRLEPVFDWQVEEIMDDLGHFS